MGYLEIMIEVNMEYLHERKISKRTKFIGGIKSAKNKIVSSIITSIGLQPDMNYSFEGNFKSLRYKRVVAITDGDVDGIHINGLILNFFHYYFPSLIERGDFLYAMRTPIMRITNGVTFYNQEVARRYLMKNTNKKVRYYKGLGFASKKEVEEIFAKRMVRFVSESKEEMDTAIDLGFSGEETKERKKWLEDYDESKEIKELELEDYAIENVTIQNFINEELIYFAIDDCKRSIPALFNGLKKSQRKVLYGVFMKGLKHNGEPLTVYQLAGYVAEKTSYHHGDASLNDTIVNMARSFVGTNNIQILTEDGQFRSRQTKPASAPRYIHTEQFPLTRLIFREEDRRYSGICRG